jgi:hypothetical protein
MADDTPRMGLPLIAAAQAQKHVTHNEALRKLDAVVQIGVISVGLNAPPASPAEGDSYIIGATPTGAWAARPQCVAVWSSGAWLIYNPVTGWLAWDASTQSIRVFTSGTWGIASSSGFTWAGQGASGNATDFIGIPSSAKEICVILDFVRLSSTVTTSISLRVGNSSGFVSAGYVHGRTTLTNGAAIGGSYALTSEFGLIQASADDTFAVVNLKKMGITDIWIMDGVATRPSANQTSVLTGRVQLPNVDRVRISTVYGSPVAFTQGGMYVGWK